MKIKIIENKEIKELYQDSGIFEEVAKVTRISWINSKLVSSDYTIKRISNHLLTMEKRFPHLIVFLLYEHKKLTGWIGISKSDKGQLEIDRWHPIIHPDANQEQAFRLLVKKCIIYADQRNFKEITVTFAIDNENDHNLFENYLTIYKNLNFKISDEIQFMNLDLTVNNQFSIIKDLHLQLLPLVEVDEYDIGECLYESFKDSKDRFFFKGLSKNDVISDFKRRIAPLCSINTSSIVLKDDNNIIGFGLVKDREFDTHLDLLCTHPDYRNKGYSKIIMKHIISSLKEHVITSLTLGVDPINSAALSLYKKLGFKKINSIVELKFIST